ncbi:MAG: hypothetical protein COX96_07725 [Candidatus Omnitrophica bacterium CG_4_10_14_0_2_um_filter_44_9]|nr:MAG: hypothetical protein COX96_07725 [Candidatus Omnitrophica bacterium CG_4_10_14_0_2_um_filter_44_9]
MEILIILLLLGFLVLVGFIFKFTTADSKQQKDVEDAKVRHIADIEAEMGRKDVEMKKMMHDRQRLEDEFFKARDESSVFKKDNSELTAKLKQLERLKEDFSGVRDELKQKDIMLAQETLARQKLQGEVSLRESELDKLKIESQGLKAELKKTVEMYEGLKLQFNEIEAELQKAHEPPKKAEAPKPGSLKIELPRPEPAKAEASKVEQSMPEFQKVEPFKPEPRKAETSVPDTADVTKVNIKKDVPSDTDFLKAGPSNKTDEQMPGAIQEGAFKLTNINKPSNLSKPSKPQDKDKQKSKKETLIQGFQPKEHPKSPA